MNSCIKVMSFNMRTAVLADGANSFWERKPRILAMLERERPDIIGFQEVTDEMREWLGEVLADYTVVGCGREKHYDGESVAIALRRGAFELLSLRHFWLSHTPSVPGSRYGGDQSSCPRITAVAELYCKREHRVLTVLNTHLDHKGRDARYLGMLDNARAVLATDAPFVFMGDMNALPDSPELLLAKELLATRGGRCISEGVGATFHGFKGAAGARHEIDYIFTDLSAAPTRLVPDEGKDGLYYSDHFALTAELTFSDDGLND